MVVEASWINNHFKQSLKLIAIINDCSELDEILGCLMGTKFAGDARTIFCRNPCGKLNTILFTYHNICVVKRSYWIELQIVYFEN